MKFETTRFGTIDVANEDIIVLPEGPLGFPDCTRFVLIDEEAAAPFRRLQSLDNPALAFVVVDPLIVRPDYHFNVTRDDLKAIKSEETDNLLVYCIVTMAVELEHITVNLQGPVVINPDAGLGHQFVLVDSEYTTKEPLIKQIQASAGQTSLTEEKAPAKKAV